MNMLPPQPQRLLQTSLQALVSSPQASMEFQPQQQTIPIESLKDELNEQLGQDILLEDCQGKSCCPIESEESMQLPSHCNCEAVEVPGTATSSEHSSSYNSCTLPLKPLKGILKKSSQSQSAPTTVVELSSSSLTRLQQLPPQDILCHVKKPQSKHLSNQFEVVPFDQVPPCDDCMQHARHWGSYGDVCQNLEMGMSCGFQMSTLQKATTLSPTHSSLSQNSAQIEGALVASQNLELSRLCCKHEQPRQNNLRIAPLPAGSNLLVISRQNSFDDKEEVEAVESSV